MRLVLLSQSGALRTIDCVMIRRSMVEYVTEMFNSAKGLYAWSFPIPILVYSFEVAGDELATKNDMQVKEALAKCEAHAKKPWWIRLIIWLTLQTPYPIPAKSVSDYMEEYAVLVGQMKKWFIYMRDQGKCDDTDLASFIKTAEELEPEIRRRATLLREIRKRSEASQS